MLFRFACVVCAIFALRIPALAAPALLYASEIAQVDVYDEYAAYPLPVAQLTTASGASSPLGLAVDVGGNLWVANGGGNGTNAVLEYAPGSPTPSFVIPEPDSEAPASIAVGSDGVVYVASYRAGSLHETIAEYASGSKTPRLKFLAPSSYLGGIALDAAGNLYVAYQLNDGRGGVERYKPNQSRGEDLGISLTSTGGIAFDPQGRLVALDSLARSVHVYALGTTKPLRTIRVDALLFYGTLALDRDGTRLYVAVGGGFCCGPAAIFAFDYKTGTQVGTITSGFPASYPATGLAVAPAR